MSKRTTANNELKLNVWVRAAKQHIEMAFYGRVFLVGGREVVLFPISVMASAIGRDRETLIGWEKLAFWPKPMWQVPDKRTKRWYSRAQIVEAHCIHIEMCGDKPGLAYSRHFDFDGFFRRIKRMWRTVDAVVVPVTKEKV